MQACSDVQTQRPGLYTTHLRHNSSINATDEGAPIEVNAALIKNLRPFIGLCSYTI